MTSNEDGIDDPLGQAFNQPMEDLISPLPPVSQCNTLVENFFTIFSPVRLLECVFQKLVHLSNYAAISHLASSILQDHV